MNSRQNRIVRMLSSITVGIIAFCLTLPLVIFLGSIFLSPPQGHAFFSAQDAILFLISIFVGLTVAIFVGIKYYRYLGKSL